MGIAWISSLRRKMARMRGSERGGLCGGSVLSGDLGPWRFLARADEVAWAWCAACHTGALVDASAAGVM